MPAQPSSNVSQAQISAAGSMVAAVSRSHGAGTVGWAFYAYKVMNEQGEEKKAG